jgi:mono/diheme cytochrome c family protein
MRGVALTIMIALFGPPAVAADAVHPPIFSTGAKFVERTGETLYAAICQDCHMADGKGAAGAGRYPALANNPKLEASGYPVTMVLRGLNGMPSIGTMLSDEQVAQVVNYVRTHFGNNYTDAVKPEDVKALR